MSSGLGVGVGSVNSVAAVDALESGSADGSGLVTVTRPSTLQLSEDDAPVLGVDRRTATIGRHSNNVLVDGFLSRVGDPVGILADDGSIYRGEDLMATAIGCLIEEASTGLTGDPTVVATYPASWPHYTVDALREALERAGFGDVTPVPEPAAAVRWLEASRGPLGEGAVVVYDLGGTSLDVTVVRTGETTGILGTPIRSDDVSGTQFDHLTMQYVLANAVDVDGLDPFDPATESALTELRARCSDAKEALSADTETALSVTLPGVQTDVRLVRGELEDLLREPLLTSVELVAESIRVAGLEPGDVSQVLLVGGGASIPLVAELISSNLGLPVVSSAKPNQTAALGAAMLARELANASAALAEPIAAAAAPNLPAVSRVLAPAVRPVPPRPPTPPAVAAEPAGTPRWKKLAIVGAAVAAIMVVTAGGLSLGTGKFSDEPTKSGPANSTSAGLTTAPAAGETTAGEPSGSAESGSNGAQTTGQPGTTGSNGSGQNSTQAPGQSAANGGNPAPQTQQNPAGGNESPANPAPGDSTQPNQIPAYTPPPVVVPDEVPGQSPIGTLPNDPYDSLPGLPAVPTRPISIPTGLPLPNPIG
ncbi:Hsp70 family protein [Antrihabitans sp. YC2-6]|uniref:Hsp70 family protein n=1 Tax=Antrihabitans sp. YC2-6 TaxID=2799498 RepID=UPI0018F79AA2|nr:Hsp70 family protein [Antrihabitans sp. YC2-6]MBJ8348684.1 Hsp70 family protein [Antrihabitans sp. YC2-6]